MVVYIVVQRFPSTPPTTQ